MRKQLERRLTDELRRQRDGLQIVMEERPPAAMDCVACLAHAGPTIAPRTRASEVCPILGSEEQVRATANALGPTSHAPGKHGEACEVARLADGDEHINVLRVRFISENRSEQGDALYPHERASLGGERAREPEQGRS